MTTISAKIIEDSRGPGPFYKRLTTMELTYPRFIHSEFMTHRMFSRNASSSRAIPVQRQIEAMIADPAIPLFWGSNKPGMQAGAECTTAVPVRNITDPNGYTEHLLRHMYLSREEAYIDEMHHAIAKAKAYDYAGYHKQIINRILEPYMHIKVVVSSTEWANFFELRDHPDAEPHIQLLAQEMRKALIASQPQNLDIDQWHLPYTLDEDKGEAKRRANNQDGYWSALRKVSVARCARVSYKTHDGQRPDYDKDIALYDQLVGAVPLHASPAEHQAKPDGYMIKFCANDGRWFHPELHGNFVGWCQFRKKLERNLAKGNSFGVAA